jgi:hypothetical protein
MSPCASAQRGCGPYGRNVIAAGAPRGDVDVHVRVARTAFAAASKALMERWEPYRRDMWTDGFATFVLSEPATLPVGIALTARGSEHDVRFRAAWKRLARSRVLLREYNEMKLRHQGSLDEDAYRAEKAAFFANLAPPPSGASR